MSGDSATSEAGASSQHVPLHPENTYRRMRELALAGELTPAARSAIRECLSQPLADHIRHLVMAAEALDGPDPEVSLLYIFDAVATIRGAFTALDARISR